VVSVTFRPLSFQEGTRVRIEIEAGCAKPVGKCLEMRKSLTGVRTPVRPAHSIVAMCDTPPRPPVLPDINPNNATNIADREASYGTMSGSFYDAVRITMNSSERVDVKV
jgi:hypothetical protein